MRRSRGAAAAPRKVSTEGSRDLLFEIGVEELPARFVPDALAALSAQAKAAFDAAGLEFRSHQTLGTPRRLALLVLGLANGSKERVQEFFGPPVAQSKDPEGNWTPAAQGFARSQSTTPEKLETRQTEKGERLCFVRREAGVAAAALLPELLTGLIRKLPFPKNMVWEESRISFARPIRWLVAVHGAELVKLEIAGVKSGKKTFGLRAQDKKPFDVSAESYVKTLRNKLVIVDPAERRGLIEKQIAQTVKPVHGRVPLEEYGALLDEVVHLVEHPVAILGHFDARYLRLPAEVLVTSMKKHQKFFPVMGAEGLLAHFVGIRNGISIDQAVVREGYERVLAARLSDAAFFFEQDRKTRLEEKAPLLKGVLFQKDLGSVWDKAERVQNLAGALAKRLGFDDDATSRAVRIVRLSKADLVTAMVGEFPELQGVMGRLYAEKDGEHPDVARGVEEHYWPLTAEGNVPAAPAPALAALADKFDSLTGYFRIGITPSGSQDPYGLRRAAVGVLRILAQHRWRLSLRETLGAAVIGMPEKKTEDPNKAAEALLDFLKQRWVTLMEAKGYRFDEVQAAASGHDGFDDPVDAESRLKALSEVRRHPDFEPLATAFKRAANILRQAKQKNIAFPSEPAAPALREAAEKDLFDKLQELSRAQNDAAGGHYVEALKSLVSLREPVDAFFAGVMVMDQDESVRANRLALLSTVVRRFKRVADLSQLQDIPGNK